MKYAKITDETRRAFIDKVQQGVCTIKQAAKQFGIKFSTGKAILSTYKHEGRVGKKQKRIRKIQKPIEDDKIETFKTLKEEPIQEAKVQVVENGQNSYSQFNSYMQQLYYYQYWLNSNAWLQYYKGAPAINYYQSHSRF